MAIAKGQDTIVLVRKLSEETTQSAGYIMYQTDYTKDMTNETEETITKDGVAQSATTPTTEISLTALSAVDDEQMDAIEDSMIAGEPYGFWEINKAVQGVELGDEDKYKAVYQEGIITSFSKSAGAEGSVEITLDVAVYGIPQRGFATLTLEQQEVVQYAFKDTTPVV